MNIVGFNFTKIAAERKRSMSGQVKVNNNVKLKELSEAKIGIGEGAQQAIRVSFLFVSEYQPNMASLSMDGDVLILLAKADADKLMNGWSAKKELPSGVASRLMNHILDRCNIQALLLAKDLNLPSPVPLPRVNVSPKINAPAKKTAKKAKK